MRNCMFKVLVAGVFGLLVGCQSNPGKPASLFGAPFANPSFAPAQGDLTQSVQEALMRNDELAVAPIRVETRQSVVILSGYVKKIRQSDTAELIARQVPGVHSVENRIIVRP
ncbi:BON domain-containing protein [Legionella lytica]|uniref:BON domain-containing protein n=1 Tax=Legionella lytica TaxID=96232 RepID=A0ABW8D391_9GAMM